MAPDFIDTDNCPLWMFPVFLLLLFCLLDFTISNKFGMVQKRYTSDQANISRYIHCAVVFFVNLLNIFATIFAGPS